MTGDFLDKFYAAQAIHARDERLGIDRRQRLAAVQLLVAADLRASVQTASLEDFMENVGEATAILPDVKMDQLAPFGPGGRKAALKAARALIDEMLEVLGE